MKKILLLLTAAALLSSCEIPGFGEKSSTTSAEISKSKNNKIVFKNNKIVLSSNYELVSVEEFKNRLNALPKDSKFRGIALDQLQEIEAKETEFEVFADKNNVANHVFVYATNFIVFDDYLAAKYVAKLNNELKDESNKQEVRYKRIHGRYFFTNEAKVVKLKYVKAHKKERRFQTEYTVASKTGGMALLVSNVNGVDFEENLKRFLN
ncbi:hypothetical protein [Aquimarina brevivitae]|uniref:Lipoprotein n=1 Tax=Aquimarina brevivitae TaxID=323412 RepID=A0A4Q7PFP7_9FLAO|nr:hypothetical protein [Aquimarina brevivitae]RZS99165.1 hypothetical protein EV197_0374 [Aquimarina brevivitae]